MTLMYKVSIGILWLLCASIPTPEAAAADIRPVIHGSGSFREIVIEGRIEPGDSETFVRIVRENQAQIVQVYVFSPGGDFLEAMKIGRAVRALELDSRVPMRDSSGRASCDDFGVGLAKPRDPANCTAASAAFFIHIGGVRRAGTFIAVHRPYFAKEAFGALSQAGAEKAFNALQDAARAYMQDMGVPKHIQEDVLGTPSDQVLVLDEKTIKTHFWGELPYRHEWTRARCSRLTEAETARSENYSRRLRGARSASDSSLSPSDWADLGEIQKKQSEENKCAIAIIAQRRVEAYERYFGEKPSDYGSHNFARWSESPRYLGKRFHELLSEERFEEEKFAGATSLRRPATASAPAITLSDSKSKPRVVGWINLVSTPNPSPEFIQRVVKSLSESWGRPSDSNGGTEWVWQQSGFAATLAHRPTSAQGSFLSLVVEEK